MFDALGDRMKRYERVNQMYLPRRTHTIIRIDGKNFSKLLKNHEPFDPEITRAMILTSYGLVEQFSTVQMAYTQSDEISLLLTDFSKKETEAEYAGNVQKLCSISASIATEYFNRWAQLDSLAFFDSRVFSVPDPVEVVNYFIWRLQDCKRNSIQKVAQELHSPKKIHGLCQKELLQLSDVKQCHKALSLASKQGIFLFKNCDSGRSFGEPFAFDENTSLQSLFKYLESKVPVLGY